MATEQTMLLRVGGVSMSRRGGRSPANLRMAAAHNLRAEQNEKGARAHIDPSRSGLNQILRGPATPGLVSALAQTRMAEGSVDPSKLRRDHVQAIELVASLPPSSGADMAGFFAAVLAWTEARYGANNVLSFVVHRDEAVPHCHALVLPLVDGRMAGANLKSMAAVKEMTQDFMTAVAKPFGLQRQKRKVSPVHRAELTRAVLERLNETNDPAMRSACWAAIRSQIEQDPRPMAEALAITITTKESTKPKRTLAQIMTSTGYKTSEDREMKTIAFEAPKGTKAILCSFRQNLRAQSPPISLPIHLTVDTEQAAMSTPEPEPIDNIEVLWTRVGSRIPAWQVTKAPKLSADQSRAIESLVELWGKVGCNVMHAPKARQDRHPHPERLEHAHSAQEQDHARHFFLSPKGCQRLAEMGVA